MASDPNIILQGQQFDSGNILKSFLVGQKLGEGQRKAENENRMAQILQTTPREKLADTLYQQGMFKEAQDYEKNQADIGKTNAETNLKDFEHKSKMLDHTINLVSSFAQDPMLSKERIKQSLEYAAQSGLIDDTVLIPAEQELSQIADDTLSLRNFAKQKQTQLLGAKEAVKYQMPDANAQLQAQKSMQVAQLQADTQRRGQDMSAETQRGGQQFNYDLGMQRLQNDRMKAAQGGLTGLKQPKVTEDQGKAMGWLSQADNAYKNMLSVLADDNTAMNPGIMESIAPESVKGAFRDKNRQKFVQATSSLSEALLRAATGAGITKDEAAQKIKEITPEYFDEPEVKKQKLDSIPVFLESLKTRAGQQASGYQVPGAGRGASESWGASQAPQGVDPAEWQQFLSEMGAK